MARLYMRFASPASEICFLKRLVSGKWESDFTPKNLHRKKRTCSRGENKPSFVAKPGLHSERTFLRISWESKNVVYNEHHSQGWSHQFNQILQSTRSIKSRHGRKTARISELTIRRFSSSPCKTTCFSQNKNCCSWMWIFFTPSAPHPSYSTPYSMLQAIIYCSSRRKKFSP